MKKLFLKDSLFKSSTMLGFIGSVIYAAIGFLETDNSFSVFVYSLMAGLFSLAIFFSYQSHNKNMMKGIMGALLTIFIVFDVNALTSIVYPVDKICGLIELVLSAALFINHFSINSTRLSKPMGIIVNQLLCLAIAIVSIAWNIQVALSSDNSTVAVTSIIYAIAKTCLCIAIVCVESRLDSYKKDREESGWTEGTGYPEGYVHEFEKNNEIK